MDPTLDPLAALRAIHGAQAPHWWPPAPGWWLLAGALTILLMVAVRRLRRRRRASAPWRAAARELDGLWQRYRDDGDQSAYLRALSVLLRRVVLARLPQERVAAIGGEPWLALLDRIAVSSEFSDGIGRVLDDGPYAPSVSFDADALHALARRLLRKIPAYAGHG
jgi:hypothetical protein